MSKKNKGYCYKNPLRVCVVLFATICSYSIIFLVFVFISLVFTWNIFMSSIVNHKHHEKKIVERNDKMMDKLKFKMEQLK